METHSTLIFSFRISATAKVKPLLKSLDSNLQGATLILIYLKKFRVGKKRNKTEIFLAPCPHPLLFKMSQDFVFSDSCTWIWRKNKIPCTRVHGFEEETKVHVPGYMDLKKKQNSMYPGTWIWENKILGHFEKKGVGAEWSQKKIPFCFVFCRP